MSTARPQPLLVGGETSASRVAAALREELLAGVYQPGAPMRDSEIAERAAVSRLTVREALAELTRERLLVHNLNRGVEVARLDQAAAQDIFAARRALESAGLTALVAAQPFEVGALERALVDFERAAATRDPAAGVAADVAFHTALIGATGSERLVQAAERLFGELRLVLAVTDRTADGVRSRADEHAQLLSEIATRRLKPALKALADHLDSAEREVLDALDATG